MGKINFDNASTSFPKAPKLGMAMSSFIEEGAYNVNRGNYGDAYAIEGSIIDVRDKINKFFEGPGSKYVVFTPGVTYSINYFINGYLKPGDHVIISPLEHNAVMRPLYALKESGVQYDTMGILNDGSIDVDGVEDLIRPETKAIITLHASNVFGTLVPIGKLGEICNRRGIVFVIDSAQTGGVIPISMERDHIDFLAFAGHKGLLGPQGIGGAIISPELVDLIEPTIKGGTGSISDSMEIPEFMPDRFESGTLNLPGIIGIGHSIDYINSVGLEAIHKHEIELAKMFIDYIVENIPEVEVIGDKTGLNRTSVVSINFKTIDNAEAAHVLDDRYQIKTRVGLHCAPIAHKIMGTYPQGTVRFSFGLFNTEEEVAEGLKAIEEIVKSVKN
ncbi:MAG: aminotransferase class V-fold PLP-dependent enzyme [Tissierellia bacterium]|nr:aminotransferase class V-fold PLP-dependent enzyme [Tissierellia bacterium]